DLLHLEREKILRVLGTDLRELALKPAHPSSEVSGKLPVPTTRGIRAFPPCVADRRHDLAGPREKLRELLERQRRDWLRLRLVAHLAIVRTCTTHDAAPSPPSSRTSARVRSRFRGALSSRPAISRDARRSAKAAAVMTGSRAAD